MDSGEEGSRIFSIASGDASPLFEMEDSVFHQMSKFVQVFVTETRILSVFPWRDDGIHPLTLSQSYNGIAVIAPVCDEVLGPDPCHKG